MEEVAPELWIQGGPGFQEAEKRALSSLFHLSRTPHPCLQEVLSFIPAPHLPLLLL